MKRWLKYLLPATLVAGFLCSLASLLEWYPVQVDDCYYDGLTCSMGLFQSYKYYCMHVNGRWLGNAVACMIFYFAGHHFLLYAITLALMAALFACAAGFLFRKYVFTFRRQTIPRINAFAFGLVFTSVLYFMMYPGRREVWGWLSSGTVHLLSVTLCMFLVGLLLDEAGTKKRFLIILLAFSLGGLNEVNAFCTAVLLTGLYLMRNAFKAARLSRLSFVLAIGAIFFSLLLNYLLPGYSDRMNGLPGFVILQSLKNTLHSFLMPFIEPDAVSLTTVLALVLLFLLSLFMQRENKFLRDAQEKKAIAFGAGLLALSVFLHCFILSDVIPARGALWAYTLLLFLISIQLTKSLITFYKVSP